MQVKDQVLIYGTCTFPVREKNNIYMHGKLKMPLFSQPHSMTICTSSVFVRTKSSTDEAKLSKQLSSGFCREKINITSFSLSMTNKIICLTWSWFLRPWWPECPERWVKQHDHDAQRQNKKKKKTKKLELADVELEHWDQFMKHQNQMLIVQSVNCHWAIVLWVEDSVA